MGKTKEVEQEIEDDIVGDIKSDIQEVMPTMSVAEKPQECIVSDEALLGIYNEIVVNLREDRVEINGLLANFVEMVINEGDSTTSSKEALVNLVKIKSDSSDKMAKIAELMTRVKLKDSFPKYLRQDNTINIGDNQTKRELLKQIERHQKKKENNVIN